MSSPSPCSTSSISCGILTLMNFMNGVFSGDLDDWWQREKCFWLFWYMTRWSSEASTGEMRRKRVYVVPYFYPVYRHPAQWKSSCWTEPARGRSRSNSDTKKNHVPLMRGEVPAATQQQGALQPRQAEEEKSLRTFPKSALLLPP